MAQQVHRAVARNLGRFMDLPDAGIAQLAQLLASPLLVKARRKLIDEGRSQGEFYIVLSGWLAEYRLLRDGRRQIFNFRLPGEVVGIEALLYDASLQSVATLTPSAVAAVTWAAFDRVQRQFPRLATALFLSRLSDNAILHEWAVNLGRRPAYQRVAHLLLELDRRLRMAGAIAGPCVPFPLTQQDIADSTGLTSPYVNRILQDMRKDGLIRRRENALEIGDGAALAKAAGFRPGYLDIAPRTGWRSAPHRLGPRGAPQDESAPAPG
ncbi:MAG TPA: Crp/Fnr family transcriptional regulator [Rhizomicrobium sp.]|nr:Crp/Fnr family transcriptional regulator [Rhizomicrobium sp.]